MDKLSKLEMPQVQYLSLIQGNKQLNIESPPAALQPAALHGG